MADKKKIKKVKSPAKSKAPTKIKKSDLQKITGGGPAFAGIKAMQQ